jgi:hypothetical protein
LKPGEKVVEAAGVFQIERVDKRRISRIRFVPTARLEDKAVTHSALLTILGLHSLTIDTVLGLGSLPLTILL